MKQMYISFKLCTEEIISIIINFDIFFPSFLLAKSPPRDLQISVLLQIMFCSCTIDHFTVVCLVAWPLNESEAGGDLVVIETSLLFLCKFLLISMRTASLA